MRIVLSLLLKLLVALAGLASLAFLTLGSGGSPGRGTQPDPLSTLEQDSPDPYALPLPVHGEPLRPGWSRPAPEVIPHPTYWPMVFGLGAAFLMWGFISNLFVLGLGFFFLVIAILGWVMDLLFEFKNY